MRLVQSPVAMLIVGVLPLLSAAGAIGIPGQLAAQGTAALSDPAVVVTEADVLRHMEVLSSDSMASRVTPSAELDRTARYVAEQFAKLGLQPGARLSRASRDAPVQYDWFQRYPLPGQQQMDYSFSKVSFDDTLVRGGSAHRGKHAVITREAGFGSAAYLGSAIKPEPRYNRKNVLVTGRHTEHTLARYTWNELGVIYVPSPGLDSAEARKLIAKLAAESRGVIVLASEDSAAFMRSLDAARQQPLPLIDEYLDDSPSDDSKVGYGIIHVRPDVVEPMLAQRGMSLARLRADTAAVVRDLPGLDIRMDIYPQTGTRTADRTAPNVLGILPGRDSALGHLYFAFVARMDKDTRHKANENTAGLASLLALAKAFSQPGARPRHPLVFVAVSGTTDGLWGSKFFGRHPPSYLAGAIVLGQIGTLSDSVRIDGAQDLELPTAPAWIAASHPELGLAVAAGQTVTTTTGNAFAFVRDMIPALYIRTSDRGDTSSVRSPDATDASQAARIARLVFYVGQTLTNEQRRLGWSEGGRRRVLEMRKRILRP